MLFDSRNDRFKSPFGAVPCGTAVRFAPHAEPGEAVVRCVLLTHAEFSDVWTETELSADGAGGFSGVFTAPETPELVWYHFRLHWADGGECCFGTQGYCSWQDVEPWQLTVYDDSRPTPAWFGEGVTYQIFPDRFRRAHKRGVEGLVGHRTLHERWDEPMDYLPDANGDFCTDFFGGDLSGITEKLDYLVSLGVTTLYLNPIFESSTNHRYDTADYRHIDPLLGSEDDLRTLCARARERGIRVILDGVFNHTGANSVYFNKYGFYPSVGAAQSEASPYAKWYRFSHFPDEYDAWWGIKNLPAVEESCEDYVNFIIEDRDSVVRHWLRAGASGWRLDVADELPDWFIEKLRRAVDEETDGGFLLGEVWEDGSTKIAYSQRRRYLLGRETHALMNYPFRNAILSYLLHGRAEEFRDEMETLRENYPAPAYFSAMNFLSTHDTPRLLTVLGYGSEWWPQTRQERAERELSRREREVGLARLRLAALVMFSFPGAPTVYYGDEAGMEGFEDPFNRGTYPWGHENRELIAYFARLGALRGARASLRRGSIEYLLAEENLLAFARDLDGERTLTVTNAGAVGADVLLPWRGDSALDALTGRRFEASGGTLRLHLAPHEGMMLIE